MSKRGFTVIELVIVCAIIGVLSAIVVLGAQQVRSTGRDSEVRSHVSQILLALERYRNDDQNFRFPGTYGQGYCLKTSGSCWNGQYSGNSTVYNALDTYLPTVPTPPNTKSGEFRHDAYVFFPSTNQNFYGAGPGSYLIWPQENSIPADRCPGAVRQESDGIYYCYQLIR